MSMNGIDFAEVVTLVNDPEPRISNSGGTWVTFRVAYNPREKDRQSGQYKDGETTWLNAKAFGTFADRVASTFHKGDRVLVKGRMVSRSYADNGGVERTSLELTVDEIGACPRFADVQVTRQQRTQGGTGASQGSWASADTTPGGFGPQNSDPFTNGGGSGGGFNSDQPF